METLTRSITTEASFETSDRFLERLQQGDEAAYGEFFHLYKDLVYTLALKLLVEKNEAMDVTQEVFLTLFRKVAGFRGECSIKTWLYRVTINQISNRNRWWKRRWRNRTISLSAPARPDQVPAMEIPDHVPSPARSLLNAELCSALEAALRDLPFERRVTVVLRDVDGLSYEEIGEVTGASLGTVKSRIGRAREQLRAALKGFEGGEGL